MVGKGTPSKAWKIQRHALGVGENLALWEYLKGTYRVTGDKSQRDKVKM